MHAVFAQPPGFARISLAWALTASMASPVGAQSNASDMDNWVQFPPRPRANAMQPVPQQITASPRQSPASVPTTASPSAPPLVSTTNERDNWIRFPIRPNAPVVAEPPPAKKEAPPVDVRAPEVTTKTIEIAPSEKRQEVSQRPVVKNFAGFKVQGNESMATTAILSELNTLVGTAITEDNLQKVIDTVSGLYQKNGYLATAEMPPQDLTSGWAEIKVVESKFSGTVMEDPNGKLSRTRLPIDIVDRLQHKGTIVSLTALDTAGALLAEIPGVEAKISLRAGEKTGETQAVATIAPSKPLESNVSLDNGGAKATGEIRTSAKVALNNPLKIGDAVSAQLLHSEGLEYQKYSYSLPVGSAGVRAGINTSSMQYKVVASEFQNLNAKGPSSTQGVEFTIPWVRENFDSVSLQLAYDQKKFKNEAADMVLSQYTGNAFTAYFEANHNDGLGGETSASAQAVRGTIDLSSSTVSHQTTDATTTQTEGKYSKLRIALTHKQTIDSKNAWVVSTQSQWANKNLDGSERFYLGGMQGVRAYPTNEAGGSLGQLVSMEWQRNIHIDAQPWTAAGFYDVGGVTVNKNNNFTKAASPNQYSLSGAGVWLGTTRRNAYGISTLRFIAAQRLGTNPVATSNGLDQDGTRVLNRYRFSLNHSF